MNFLDLFNSRDKNKRLSHIKNLIGLACCDGKLDKVELDLIIRIANRVGITRSEIEKIGKNSSSILFIQPDNDHERLEQLYDLVLVMMVDGEIREIEIAILTVTAQRLGIKHLLIDSIISALVELINGGVSVEFAYSRFKKLLFVSTDNEGEMVEDIRQNLLASINLANIFKNFDEYDKRNFDILVSRFFDIDNINMHKFNENLQILNNANGIYESSFGTQSIRRICSLSPIFIKLFVAAYPDVYLWHHHGKFNSASFFGNPRITLIDTGKYSFSDSFQPQNYLRRIVDEYISERGVLECAI